MLRNLFKRQLPGVIEWKNHDPAVLFSRLVTPTDEIKNASKLIVAPGQGCVLVYEGKIIDVLSEPGIHDLKTANTPFITSLASLLRRFESEHKLYLYFWRQTEQVNQQWGTSSPVKYTEPNHQLPMELGAYGTYAFRIEDARLFFENIVGSRDSFTQADLQSIINSRIAPEIAALLAQAGYAYTQIDAQLAALSAQLKAAINQIYNALGLRLTDMRIAGTTFSEDTLARIRQLAQMKVEAASASEVGLDYVGLERLRALRDAAKNESGLAAAGLQLGAGLDLGKTLLQPQQTAVDTQQQEPQAKLRMLKSLLEEGILTQEEFDSKKRIILDNL
ncbi:SPFH domain-containing protein [Intestinirhabdus alba]|jgi:membrane protease subunit (stomatin/prohibitin family)|uniref:SPFH domain-containing protein n=1 Tax=Intestinirhabdus alba TaxID=2899544 RepID=A0A6L6IRK0_9ENTR|nr:SPFH domain-containing protein [Intestinirhabdus alba]MTH47433.1 SPFH domain-containing protein [Intestinirhabdus alba]